MLCIAISLSVHVRSVNRFVSMYCMEVDEKVEATETKIHSCIRYMAPDVMALEYLSGARIYSSDERICMH